MKKTSKLNMVVVTGILIVSLFTSLPAFSATVSVGSKTAITGASEVPVPVSISLFTGDNVAALNMSISFNSDELVFRNAQSGNASESAGKTLAFNSPSDGIVKLVIYSMDSELIRDGDLVNLIFDTPSDSQEGQVFDVSITECVLSDGDSNAVSVSNSNGQITISNSAQDPNGGSDSDQDTENGSGSGGCFISIAK